MLQRILLVEPKTRTAYPPLGLMKIATYHKIQGDEVCFVMGKDRRLRDQRWDLIYVSSVFTYDLSTLIDTIKFYRGNFFNMDNVQVGGISATLLSEQVKLATGVLPHKGLLNEFDPFLQRTAERDTPFSYLLTCGPTIDNLPPDYSIFSDEQRKRYSKILDNAFFLFSTKGCPNKCGFCAVTKLEPAYIDYLPIKPRIEYMRHHFGDRAGLLLLDNNIAASRSYNRIIDEIKDCGFARGARMEYEREGRKIFRDRFVDFNQGVDLRLMDQSKMSKLAEIAIKPLRLAFDSIALESQYEEKMRMAIGCGITNLSNYMLYNFKDKPEDLYRRFQVNMRILRDHPDVKIFSFPMRYSPVERTDRNYISKHWSKREVRAIQLILNATHGIVSHRNSFFNRAFGKSLDCYLRVLLYPYHYLINRDICEYNNLLIPQWEKDYSELSSNERLELKAIISDGPILNNIKPSTKKISLMLEHYEQEYAKIMTDSVFISGHF